MDSELKCNRLTCRKPLVEKAVVTTCSHIFCIECANELFNSSRLCPACETTLTEPDDVVICSLQPTNDYKTSVLSGLSPSTILEICSRAISFWQYQIHQENTFQQAVIRNLNDKNAQLQKQLDNVVREANGEINLLNKKREDLERDLELERRRSREFQDSAREREKEYQKLKAQFDKLKRKALFAPAVGNENNPGLMANVLSNPAEDQRTRPKALPSVPNTRDITLAGGMEVNRLQRTPLISRTNGGGFPGNQPSESDWAHIGQLGSGHRQPFSNFVNPGLAAEHSHRSLSERSPSTNEVEQMLIHQHQARNTIPMATRTGPTGWQVPGSAQSNQRAFAPVTNKGFPGRFRPAR